MKRQFTPTGALPDSVEFIKILWRADAQREVDFRKKSSDSNRSQVDWVAELADGRMQR
jgi:hypothetical protein